MSMNKYLPKKFDPIPKRHHYFAGFLFIAGCLLPPIAVVARFGVGTDFFINIIMTLCGYFPGHGHNFYLQNIRNNENKKRAPKWARRAGLIDPAEEERKRAKSQWKKRFDERNNISTHVGADLEEGETGDNYVPVDPREEERRARLRNEGLWDEDDAGYYNPDAAPAHKHKHYPMNFDDAIVEDDRPSRGGSGGGKGERDPITGALIGGSAYSDQNGRGGYPSAGATDADVPEWGKDYGSRGKKSKNPLKRNKKSGEGMGVAYNNSAPSGGGGSGYGRGGYDDLEERRGGGGGGGGGYGKANGGAGYSDYGPGAGSGRSTGGGGAAGQGGGQQAVKKKNNDPFDHEF